MSLNLPNRGINPNPELNAFTAAHLAPILKPSTEYYVLYMREAEGLP